ncbi:GNAT family N-acetyltransferase [Halobacillus litoralis]|uniref:GNAT family N-acetyltransferase n=1 Tax=Halobacillus litoralis TaxID=45668 RepID=UPI001CFCA808|nr:GNAT family N-acetyltransferase [Halobacillus litoralis]
MVHLQKVQLEELSTLHNLMQFYIYEFSKYLPEIKLGNDGSYQPFHLDKYWTDDHFHAYFIRLDEELIGFALVGSAVDSTPNTIQEYFIMAKHKGKGYGKEIAKRLFKIFPGEWEVIQIEQNKPARAFWSSVIKEISGRNYTERYEDGKYIQRFQTRND